MTDYSDITQYQQDTITQILLSLVQYEFLPASAQNALTQTETHIHKKKLKCTPSGSSSVSRRNRCPRPGTAVVLERHGFMQKVKRSYEMTEDIL